VNEHVTIFDKQYSTEKAAEALAVNWAVITGACNACRHMKICTSDMSVFLWETFPHDAPCMVKMREEETE